MNGLDLLKIAGALMLLTLVFAFKYEDALDALEVLDAARSERVVSGVITTKPGGLKYSVEPALDLPEDALERVMRGEELPSMIPTSRFSVAGLELQQPSGETVVLEGALRDALSCGMAPYNASYAAWGDTCDRPLRIGDPVVVSWGRKMRGDIPGFTIHRGSRAEVMRRLERELFLETLKVLFGWLMALLCFGGLLGWGLRYVERRGLERAEGNGLSAREGGLAETMARLRVMDAPELCAGLPVGDVPRALAGALGRTALVGAVAGTLAVVLWRVSPAVLAILGVAPLPATRAGLVGAFLGACGVAAAVHQARAWKRRERLRKGDPEWAMASDVLLQALGHIAPLVEAWSEVSVECHRSNLTTAHGQAGVTLSRARTQASLVVYASPGLVRVVLTVLEAPSPEAQVRARTDTRWMWREGDAALRLGWDDPAVETSQAVDGGDVARAMGEAVRARLEALGYGVERDAEATRGVERASWSALARGAERAAAPEAQEVGLERRGEIDAAALERVPPGGTSALGERVFSVSQAALWCGAVLAGAMTAWAGLWEPVWGSAEMAWWGAPLLVAVAGLGGARASVRYARRARELRIARSVLVWDGEALALGDARVELGRPFRLSLTREGAGDSALLGVALAQTAVEGGVARLRLAVPVEPGAALDALDALDSSAPVLASPAFEAWVWPLIAFYAQAHGEREVFLSIGRATGAGGR